MRYIRKIYSYDEMQDPAIDIISICTPPDVRANRWWQRCGSGKTSGGGKPLAMTYEDVLKMKMPLKSRRFHRRQLRSSVESHVLNHEKTIGRRYRRQIMYMKRIIGIGSAPIMCNTDGPKQSKAA